MLPQTEELLELEKKLVDPETTAHARKARTIAGT
jgi:hypothetical protein